MYESPRPIGILYPESGEKPSSEASVMYCEGRRCSRERRESKEGIGSRGVRVAVDRGKRDAKLS